MALFLLPVRKYGHVPVLELPVRLGVRGDEAPPVNSISGACGQGCWSQEGRGTKCKWKPPFPESSALVLFTAVADSRWAGRMRCLFWESTHAARACRPLSSPAI